MFLFPQPSEESPPMFENGFIDRFSRTHFMMVPIMFVPAVTILVVMGVMGGVTWWQVPLLFAGGFLYWTLLEYWLHRTLFHWIPKAAWGERFHFFLHGVHHNWPNDKYRLVMPPAVSISLFWFFFAMNWFLLGVHGLVFHAGLVMGYMVYDLTHYYVHHFAPKSRRFKALRTHHFVHHFKKGHWGKFGVSTRLWDHVFRTMEDRGAARAKGGEEPSGMKTAS